MDMKKEMVFCDVMNGVLDGLVPFNSWIGFPILLKGHQQAELLVMLVEEVVVTVASLVKKLTAIFLFSGDSWLRDYESESIAEFLNLLNSKDRNKILLQLARCNLVQRSVDGRIVQFYESIDQYRKRWGDELKVNLGGEIEKKYKLDFLAKNGERVVGNFFIGKGFITCIEYKLMPCQYNPRFIKIFELVW